MDFLDPKKRRAQQVRLLIGHGLMVLLVAISTYILVYRAYGYGIDTKTGEVIQKGLVFVDSAPDGAQILINGKYYGNTNKSFALDEGKYSVEINKTGYRTWKHELDLQGGSVMRLSYPFLFPAKLSSAEFTSFSKPLDLITQSPDKSIMVFSEKNVLSSLTLVNVNKLKNNLPTSSKITLAKNLFTAGSGKHSLKMIEWSTDNKHILVQHSWAKGSEFVMLDIDQPTQSFNISNRLTNKPVKISLINKKYDNLFIFTKDKLLSKYNVKDDKLTTFAKNIISFKPHGDKDVLLTRISSDKKTAELVFIDGDKSYLIRKMPVADDYLINLAQYENNWYIAIAVNSEKKTYIYKNPQNLYGIQPSLKNVLTIVMGTNLGVDKLEFSDNARFIMAKAGQQFAVYDNEQDQKFNYYFKDKLDSKFPTNWMDGHRIITRSDSKITVFDFDETNIQQLVSTEQSAPVFFNRDYTELYNLNPSKKNKAQQALYITQMRTPADQ